MSRAFPSKYDNKGACSRCRGDINIGQMVRFVSPGSKDLEHESCPSVAPPAPVPPPSNGSPDPEGPGSWTLEFTQGSLLVRRAFLRNAAPTKAEVEEFRAFTRAVVGSA